MVLLWGFCRVLLCSASGVVFGAGLAIGFGIGIGIGVFAHWGWGWNNWRLGWRSRAVVFNQWRRHAGSRAPPLAKRQTKGEYIVLRKSSPEPPQRLERTRRPGWMVILFLLWNKADMALREEQVL
jgi:hypothetical protein